MQQRIAPFLTAEDPDPFFRPIITTLGWTRAPLVLLALLLLPALAARARLTSAKWIRNYVCLVVLLVFLPATSNLATLVLGNNFSWRIFWSVPVPLLLGLGGGIAVGAFLDRRWLPEGAIVGWLLAFAIVAPPTFADGRWSVRNFGRLKVNDNQYRTAQATVALARTDAPALVTEGVAMYISGMPGGPPLIGVRRLYLRKLWHLIPDAELARRLELFGYVARGDSASALGEDLEEITRVLGGDPNLPLAAVMSGIDARGIATVVFRGTIRTSRHSSARLSLEDSSFITRAVSSWQRCRRQQRDRRSKHMPSKPRPSSVLVAALTYAWERRVFLMVGALAACYLAERRMAMNQEYFGATLERLMSGTGWTPYQYRALVPWISGLFWKAGIFTNIYGFFYWVESGFLVACLVAFRQLVALEFRSPVLCDLLGFSIFLVIPFNYIFSGRMTFFYPYDIASVFFFTVGLILLKRENWKLYYPVFALATFNREISCFLTVIYAIVNFRKRPLKQVAIHVAAQAAIWFGVKLMMWSAFSGNRGGGFILNVIDHNARNGIWNRQILSSIGYAWIPVLLMRRRIADPFFNRAVLVVYPFMAAMLFVGRLDEIRIYGELIPVFLMGAILILKDSFREELSIHAGPAST